MQSLNHKHPDESQLRLLHAWLSRCRMLMMHSDPKYGARFLDFLSGRGNQSTHFKYGWNRIVGTRFRNTSINVFVFLDDQLSFTTKEEPLDTNLSKIPTIYFDDLPAFEQSYAWKTTKQLAALLKLNCADKVNPEWVDECMDQIKFWGSLSDDKIELNFEQRIVETRKEIERRVGGQLFVLEPLVNVVDDFLALRFPGIGAMKVLDEVLLSFCTEFRDEENQNRLEIELIEHLQDITYLIIRESGQYNLTSFYECRYVAYLYGSIAMQLIGNIVKRRRIDIGSKSKLGKVAKAIDELLTHEVWEFISFSSTKVPQACSEFSSSKLLRPYKFNYPQLDNIEVRNNSSSDQFKMLNVLEDVCSDLPDCDVLASVRNRWLPVTEELLNAIGHRVIMSMIKDVLLTNQLLDDTK